MTPPGILLLRRHVTVHGRVSICGDPDDRHHLHGGGKVERMLEGWRDKYGQDRVWYLGEAHGAITSLAPDATTDLNTDHVIQVQNEHCRPAEDCSPFRAPAVTFPSNESSGDWREGRCSWG